MSSIDHFCGTDDCSEAARATALPVPSINNTPPIQCIDHFSLCVVRVSVRLMIDNPAFAPLTG